jgi:hypothetical protein
MSRSIVLALAGCFALTSNAAPTNQTERPHLPYYDWGSCPFECCTYRNWQAVEPLTIFQRRSKGAKPAFDIKKGEWIRGVTGVVVTYKAGISKVLKPIDVGYLKESNSDKPQLHLMPGDVVYTIHYLGEGFDLFWYRGGFYSDQIAGVEPDTGPPQPDQNIQIVSRPVVVWWVKVRNKEGLTGWTREARKFAHMDSCE